MTNYLIGNPNPDGPKYMGIGLTNAEFEGAAGKGGVIIVDLEMFGMKGEIHIFTGKDADELRAKSDAMARMFGVETTEFQDPATMGDFVRGTITRRN